MDLDQAGKIAAGVASWIGHEWQTITAVALAIVLAGTMRAAVRRRRPLAELAARHKPSRVDRVLTFAGAFMASSMAAYTMWLVVGDRMPEWLKWGTITFLEINTVAAAMRSRHFRLEYAQRAETAAKAGHPLPARGRDVDGLVVWLFATGSALLGLTEGTTAVERIARGLAPLVAAFSWERAMIGELRQYDAPRTRTIRWHNPVESLAVRLGLADPTEQFKTAAAADKTRRVALVVDAGYRAGLPSPMPWKLGQLVDAHARSRYHRRMRSLRRRYALDTDLLTEVRIGVAALRQADDAVSPAALADVDAWGDLQADAKAAAAAQAAAAEAREQVADLAARLERATRTGAVQLDEIRQAATAAVNEANEKLAGAREEIARLDGAVKAAEQRASFAATSRDERAGQTHQLVEQARKETAAARDEARRTAEQARRDLVAAAEQHRRELADANARHERAVAQLTAQLATTRPAPAPAAPAPAPAPAARRRPTTNRPTSPAPAGAETIGTTDPYVQYLAQIEAVQDGIPDWATRTEPISQGDVKTYAGVSGVPTQRRIKYLIEAMANSGSPKRDPMAALAWLVSEGLLTDEQVSTTTAPSGGDPA